MNEKPKHHKKERTDFAYGISRGEFITSMLAGVGSGVAAAIGKVSDLFNEDAKKASAFEAHFADRGKRLNAIDLQAMLREGKTTGQYHRAIHAEKKLLQAEFNDLALLHRGVSKNVITGTVNRYCLLGPNSVRNLCFNGAVGAAIGAAMTLSFFNGVATRDKIERIEDAVGADPSQQQGR